MLDMSFDLFDFNHHSETGLRNIATRKIILWNYLIVNLRKSYWLRKKKLQKFESSLSWGYHNTIFCFIMKIDAAEKGRGCWIQILIWRKYSLMGEPLFPWSLFDKENVLRTARLESNLMKALKVESNARFSASNTTARFVDGYAVFWHISWTEKVTAIKVCFIYLWES